MSLIPMNCKGTAVYVPPSTQNVEVVELNTTENGEYTAPCGYAYSPVIINVPTGGGGSGGSLNDVVFYDYDGTIVDSYTADEFASLTELPANPSHNGLTAQGWNWSLADAQTYVAESGKLDIGQMYVTESGDTEIDIVLHDGRLAPYLGICPNGTVEIDWGDGSAVSTVTGASLTTIQNTQHTYASEGAYTIKLHVVSGSFAIVGNSSGSIGSRLLWHAGTSNTNGLRAYQNSIQAIRLGTNVSIGTYAFNNCSSLASVTIPDGVTSIGTYAFQSCYSLASVTIPDGVTSIGNNAFQYCSSLASVTIPDGVTSIGTYAFNNCSSLASVTIPDSVTSIGGSAFSNCYSLAILVFKPTTPPTVSNANAFSNLPSDCVVYVPAGTLSAYQNATNYSNIASKMVEVSA